MSENKEKKKGVARFITPPNRLKQKVGDGGIPETLLQRGQDYVDNNPIDFTPYASKFLEELNESLKEALAAKNDEERQIVLEKMIPQIMQLKANGSMFKFSLVTYLADIVLDFLENIEVVNSDVFDIVAAHNNCLTIIVNSKLEGEGGKEGKALVKELRSACDRYNKKYNK